MTKRDFGGVVEKSLETKPKPARLRGKPKTKTTAAKKKTRPRIAPKELIGTRVPKPMLDKLRKLAAKMQRETGRRVLITDLVTEAIADLLEKHR